MALHFSLVGNGAVERDGDLAKRRARQECSVGKGSGPEPQEERQGRAPGKPGHFPVVGIGASASVSSLHMDRLDTTSSAKCASCSRIGAFTTILRIL